MIYILFDDVEGHIHAITESSAIAQEWSKFADCYVEILTGMNTDIDKRLFPQYSGYTKFIKKINTMMAEEREKKNARL